MSWRSPSPRGYPQPTPAQGGGIRRTPNGGHAADLRTLAPKLFRESKELIMNRIRRVRPVRRWVAALATLAGTLVTFGAAAPAALATLPPPEPPATAVVSPPVMIQAGGMPGWQITLIALG